MSTATTAPATTTNDMKTFNLNDAVTSLPTPSEQQEPTVFDPMLFVNNPGTYEDLHKKTKDVGPINFEGFKFVLNKQLSSHFQVNHSLTMSNVVPSGYKFGATYIGTKQVSQQEVYPIILGDVDSNGSLNANIIHQFTSNLRTRVVAQIQNSKLLGYQMTNDYKMKTATASLTAVNTSVLENSGILIAQYLQRVTRNVDMGAELLIQYGPQVPAGRIGVYSLAARYTASKDWQLSAALNPFGSAHLCYHHQSALSPIQFGVEMEANLRTMESQATFNYQIDLNKANLTFKGKPHHSVYKSLSNPLAAIHSMAYYLSFQGMIDSNWNVGSVLEKRLVPLPFTFVLSSFLNHSKSTYKFGIGLTIG